MQKEWQKPTLDVLDINKTMQGPGIRDVDATFEDDDETVHLSMS